ncbi:MAG: hypothetical protein AB7F86_09455 [Bdellovibrionales bacterium]
MNKKIINIAVILTSFAIQGCGDLESRKTGPIESDRLIPLNLDRQLSAGQGYQAQGTATDQKLCVDYQGQSYCFGVYRLVNTDLLTIRDHVNQYQYCKFSMGFSVWFCRPELTPEQSKFLLAGVLRETNIRCEHIAGQHTSCFVVPSSGYANLIEYYWTMFGVAYVNE